MAKCERHGEYHENHGCGVAVMCGSAFAEHEIAGCPLRMSPSFEQRPVPGRDRDYDPWEAPAGNCPWCWHGQRNDEMAKLRETVIEVAAEAAHEANRAYCKAIGDDPQVPWDEAPLWQRASCVAGVEYVLAHPDAGPIEQHEQWLAEKLRDKWVYGEKKDAEHKTHPCMLQWSELPIAQKSKDLIFGSVVRGVLAHHGVLDVGLLS